MSRLRLALVLGVVLLLAGCTFGPDPVAMRGQYSVKVADAALASGAPEMALRVAELIIERDPANVAAMVSRGDALYALGQLTKARAAYRTVIERDPAFVAAHIGLGRTLVRSDPRAAEAAFAAAVARDPSNTTALNNLGITRDLLGRRVEAQDAYRAALAVAPEMADVKVNLGLSLALSGRAAEAAEMMRPLVEHTDATALWRNDVAVALTLAGDRDGARLALDGIDGGKPALAAPPLPAVAIRTAPRVQVVRQDMQGAPVPRDMPASLPLPATPPVLAALDAAPAKAVQAMRAAGQSPRIDWSVLRPGGAMAANESSAAKPASPAPVAAPVPVVSRDAATPREMDGANVQLGAVEREILAMLLWQRLASRLPDMLENRAPEISRADVHGRTFWRVRTGGFVSRSEASAFCEQMRGRGAACWAI